MVDFVQFPYVNRGQVKKISPERLTLSTPSRHAEVAESVFRHIDPVAWDRRARSVLQMHL